MKELSTLTTLVTPSPIRQMFNLAIGMEDVISFTVGEPDFMTPEHIVDAAVKALCDGHHHYTPNAGILPLRQAIARKTARTHGLEYVAEDEIIVTAGGMEALFLAMQVLLNPGDEVILTDPCWTNYSRQVTLCHAVYSYVSVTESTNFQYDAAALEKAITKKTKVILINSPANPTGGIADYTTLEAIAKIALDHDLYIISDEVYEALVFGKHQFRSITAFPHMKERTVVINSFSKAYAMTGWRVGFALGPASIISNMVKFQENVAACVNSAAQYGALAALEGPQEPVMEMQRQYAKRLEVLVSELAKFEKVTYYVPQGTFYLLLDISSTGLPSAEFAKGLLMKEKVIVVPGSAFGSHGDRFVRLSFATSIEKIKEGANRIGRYIDGLK